MSAAQHIGHEVIVESPHCELVCSTDDRADWLARRQMGIGASEIAMVLGEAPKAWGGALSLYARKIGAYERDLSDVEAVFWGNKLEAPILEAYEERTGRRTRKDGLLLRSKAHPWALATLDGRTWLPANDAQPWPLEVKNVSVFKAEEWLDGPPPHYYLQIQHQMLVVGAEKATIAALLGGQRMVWADVPRDETTIRKIIYHGERFWQRVQARDVPLPDGSEETRKALAALYPEGQGIVVLPGTARDAADELEALKAERKRIAERIDEIENTVRAAIGAAEVGVLTDGRSFSNKLQHRKEFTVAANSFRVLRLHQSKNRS
jgi:putative phage-type endonuclease